MRRDFHTSARYLRPAVLAALLGLAGPGSARAESALQPDDEAERDEQVLFAPLPKEILWQDGAVAETDTDTVLFNPDLVRFGSRAQGKGRLAVPVDVIRRGLAAPAGMTGALPERSVGFRLGPEHFSVATTLLAPSGDTTRSGTRIDWKLARPIPASEMGMIWTASTGGAAGIAATPEQNATLLLGYRQRIFDHLTLTSQLSMASNFVFAEGDGLHSSLTPELKLTADLAAMAAMGNHPWGASLDVSLGRKMPLVASDYETRGTAMLRLQYRLD